jgi:hypothetical protein
MSQSFTAWSLAPLATILSVGGNIDGKDDARMSSEDEPSSRG